MTLPPSDPSPDDRRTSWLSRGLESFIAERGSESQSPDRGFLPEFDVVVVGSGYGGSVAAATLATQWGQRVCVLERGSEYLPGAFPGRMADLAGHVRFSSPGAEAARGVRTGLFDVRIGKDVSALVGNGLGGGSLINAGVMESPLPGLFREAVWPKAIRDDPDLPDGRDYLALKQRLGASDSDGAANTIARWGASPPKKFAALQRLDPAARPASITVALDAGTFSSAGIGLSECNGCGDCATGCNYGAKISLDVNLLVEARRGGAQILTGATVLRIEKGDGPLQWKIFVNHTDALMRRRQNKPFEIRASRVILAAGTYGSTEILFRSQTDDLRFSPKLGARFSANGDMIGVAYAMESTVGNCVGDETVEPMPPRPAEQRVGPTIVGLIDRRQQAGGPGLVIEDLSIPGPLRRLLEEIVTTADSLNALATADPEPHRREDAETKADSCAVDPVKIRHTLVVAMMCRDSASGQMSLAGGQAVAHGDGALHVDWPTHRAEAAFEAADRWFRQAADEKLRAVALANPMWRLLPPALDYLLDGDRGPMLTVHPLGGCPMGEDVSHGVVNHLGQVFDGATPGHLHRGLLVLDGSIVPTSLGINPALTIASLAQRSLGLLAASEDWRAGETQPVDNAIRLGSERPLFRAPPQRVSPRPTQVQFLERMGGLVTLAGLGERYVDITLAFEPKSLRELTWSQGRRTLTIKPQPVDSPLSMQSPGGRLRLFRPEVLPDAMRCRLGMGPSGSAGRPLPLSPRMSGDSAELDSLPDSQAELVATLSGTLELFRHAATTACGRRWNSLPGWVGNRGFRDALQFLVDTWWHRILPPLKEGVGMWDRVRHSWALGTRAGEIRLLEYDLQIDHVLTPQPAVAGIVAGALVRGDKRFTYRRRANPWRQMMELTLTEFPGLLASASRRPGLTLDLTYLAGHGVPLLRIVGQQDQANALVDLAALGMFFLRMLLRVHIWSFRQPDTPVPRRIDRLPGFVPGLPLPTIQELAVGRDRQQRPVFIRLTRYPGRLVGKSPPVLLIHGYSASGTSFAHRAVDPNLASHLHGNGRDVWIVDLRSSAGMPTARMPWRFEEVAYADIPVAIRHVLRETGQTQLDVIAHCMGAAMMGMALLGDPPLAGDHGAATDPFWDLRRDLHQSIRRLVLSQVGPAVVMSPANQLRAFVMRYLRHLLPEGDYAFRTADAPTLADRLLDRLLSSTPYPEDEFDRENPPWYLALRRTPWTATRHRMDALYGRDFSLKNLSDEMLAHIDDHFGPLSLETVAQVIHFARFNAITDRKGRNVFVSPKRVLQAFADMPILCVHGVENGLADVSTLDLMKDVLADAFAGSGRTPDFHALPVSGHGHQDCLIGIDAREKVFEPIECFLREGRLP